ncbi:hypothetical protein [Leminorella grimontii]|uniref:hypothetical protein n=1 Tax=Leminorella grimontii TaxID=82981 RepID=UPI0020888664|nr:hypothetical protein [Leminorella grimontii]GKX58495.1 hypothetical protein SOASR031_08100 [Leminorella grimontii]
MIHIPLTPLPHRFRGEMVACAWCADGNLAVLEVAKAPERIDGMFVPTEVDKRSWYVTLYSPDLRPFVLPPIESKINFHYVQTLGEEHILLVCARSHYRNGEGEKNAAIYDLHGRLVRRFTLGDGIQDVIATAGDELWVSYFDEGVFGNYGWGLPMGQNGLVKYDLNGNPLWQAEGFEICDCYALNVESAHSVWFYYYMDFDLVHMAGKETTRYKIPIKGAQCFAVCHPYIVMDGGYDKHGKFTLLRSYEKRMKRQDELCFTADGKNLTAAFYHMRGHCVTAYSQEGIYVAELSTALFER